MSNERDTPEDPKSTGQYDGLVSAQSYSNIAAVLAGFAFAAVVLVVQVQVDAREGALLEDLRLARDRAAIGFLLALFGCVGSAFTFAVVAGEPSVAPRSYAMALFGGATFAMSVVYVFWGLAMLMWVFLSPAVSDLANKLFGFLILTAPLYLILSEADLIIASDRRAQVPKRSRAKTWAQLSAFGYVPIVLGMMARLIQPTLPETIPNAYFEALMLASLALVFMGMAGARVLSEFDEDYLFQPLPASIWIGLQSCVSAALLLMLP